MPTESTGGQLQSPRDFVQDGWDWFRELGIQWITLSQQALGDLTTFDVTPIEFDTAFDLIVDYGTFARPLVPTVPDLGEVDVVVPDLPVVTDIALRELGDAPAEPDFGGLVYAPPAPPEDAMPIAPTDLEPTLETITLPAAPDDDIPELPTLYTLALPDVPELTIPEFTATRPDIDLDTYLPDRAFNWQEVAYSSTLLDTAKDSLEAMITGGLGLPAEIEQIIFDRGRSRADVLSTKRVQEVADELGSRGLVEPAPYLARRLDEARQAARAETSGLNRDLTIRSAEMNVEAIRFALQQAAALEVALLAQNGELNNRALQAAKITADVQVQVFNAVVARYNLDVELFKADAQVYRDQIQGEIAKAELYKAEIEGQKVVGDINEGLIRAYAEQVRTIGVRADIYRAQVDGARALAEINTQRIEQVRLRVQVFSERVKAWGVQHDAYKTQVEGALGNVKVFEAIGGVYGQRVEAYKAKGDAYVQQAQFRLEKERLGVTAFQAQLEAVRTQIQAQLGTIDARARTFQARASMYVAEGGVIAAEATANDRNAELRIAAARARAEIAQKNIDQRITQNNQIATIYVEQLKAKAQVVSQLAASTMSGVNFGASYNGSLGVSSNYGLGFNFSGDTTQDYFPPYYPYVSF